MKPVVSVQENAEFGRTLKRDKRFFFVFFINCMSQVHYDKASSFLDAAGKFITLNNSLTEIG